MTTPSEGALGRLLNLPSVTFHKIAKQRSIAVIANDGKLSWAGGRYKHDALKAALKAKPIDVGADFKVKVHEEWDGRVTVVLVTDEGEIFAGTGIAGEEAMRDLVIQLAGPAAMADDEGEDKPAGDKRAKGPKNGKKTASGS